MLPLFTLDTGFVILPFLSVTQGLVELPLTLYFLLKAVSLVTLAFAACLFLSLVARGLSFFGVFALTNGPPFCGLVQDFDFFFAPIFSLFAVFSFTAVLTV